MAGKKSWNNFCAREIDTVHLHSTISVFEMWNVRALWQDAIRPFRKKKLPAKWKALWYTVSHNLTLWTRREGPGLVSSFFFARSRAVWRKTWCSLGGQMKLLFDKGRHCRWLYVYRHRGWLGENSSKFLLLFLLISSSSQKFYHQFCSSFKKMASPIEV